MKKASGDNNFVFKLGVDAQQQWIEYIKKIEQLEALEKLRKLFEK